LERVGLGISSTRTSKDYAFRESAVIIAVFGNRAEVGERLAKLAEVASSIPK
jgi:hypothetical protein